MMLRACSQNLLQDLRSSSTAQKNSHCGLYWRIRQTK